MKYVFMLILYAHIFALLLFIVSFNVLSNRGVRDIKNNADRYPAGSPVAPRVGKLGPSFQNGGNLHEDDAALIKNGG